MGIFCELYLFKTPNGVYQPGQMVSGVIKYSLNEPMEIEKITNSLKGIGNITVDKHPGSKLHRQFTTVQSFVDVDTIIQNEKVKISEGSYEIKFNFVLPQILPSSIKFRGRFKSYKVKCSIKYYIRIKFERPGLFAFNKHFRKEIHVISNVPPRLSREPITYVQTKKVTHLFSSKDGSVNITATIENSAVPFGGRIILHYEVENNSNVVINSIITKLLEAYIFKAKGHRKVNFKEEVPNIEARTAPVDCDKTEKITIDMHIPPHVYPVENAFIVCRYYVVRIIGQLPIPHRNAVLDIPVQIGVLDESENRLESNQESISYDDNPPSYWEAMGIAKNDGKYDSDDD